MVYFNVTLAVIIYFSLSYSILAGPRRRTLRKVYDISHKDHFNINHRLNTLPFPNLDEMRPNRYKDVSFDGYHKYKYVKKSTLGETSDDSDELFPVTSSSASNKDKGIISNMFDVILSRKLFAAPRNRIKDDYDYELPKRKGAPVQTESNEEIDTDLISLTSKNIKTYLDGSRQVWVVEFYSTKNCTNCSRAIRMLEDVVKRLPTNISVGIVDIGREEDLKRLYNVRQIPSIKVFYPGDATAHSYDGSLTVKGIKHMCAAKRPPAYLRIAANSPAAIEPNETTREEKVKKYLDIGLRTNWSDILSKEEASGTSMKLINCVLQLLVVSIAIYFSLST